VSSIRIALPLACLLVSAPASAQTVREIAARGACSTSGIEGISAQLTEAQICMYPGAFVAFAPHGGITLTSSRVHPLLQASARDALWAASARTSLQITSAFRTLADQYVLYHSGACGLAATPGRSNHQTGRAVDVSNYSAARSALTGAGCTWLGSSDPVHFDCPGSDRRPDAVRTFQRLWNLNHSGDRIAEDGAYGPQTEDRLGRTPASGFALGGCGCSAHCEGTVIVGDDCARGDCAAFGALCSTAGTAAPRCVSVFCVADSTETPRAHDVCLPDGRVATCTGEGAVADARDCTPGEMCAAGVCMGAPPPPPEQDAGLPPMLADAGVVGEDAEPVGVDAEGFDYTHGSRALTGGCAAVAGTRGASSSWLALLGLGLIALRLRRRRR